MRRIVGDYSQDTYTGTAEDLAAAGLLPLHLFPGQPGVGAWSASYWPEGARTGNIGTPGRLEVRRTQNGRFAIDLSVPLAEQQRREALRDEEANKRKAERQEAQRIEDERCRAEMRAERQLGMLEALIDDMGLETVRKHVDQLCRAGSPSRSRAHLRLVWSAPVL